MLVRLGKIISNSPRNLVRSFVSTTGWAKLRKLYSHYHTVQRWRVLLFSIVCLRVSGFHILPPPLGQNVILKSRSGAMGKRCLESVGKTVKRRGLKINASDKKKPFQCQKCGRGFTLKRNKDRHVNYECGHEPRFQCPYCGLRSKQTSPVYAHIRKKHPEEEVFIFDMKL